ncbi:hypothetical protein OF846_005278 [Rhodotorula toruloides]|nr:hypothetical protein OF846_005278 [Rhodotorula toruloides]
MPSSPATPKVEVQEHLKRWRIDAARVQKLWDRIGRAGPGAGEVVEILDWVAEKQVELTREKDALAHPQKELTREERLAIATHIEHYRDTLERYEDELDEYPHDVRDTVERAYEEARDLVEDLVELREDCEEHELKNSAREITAELHRLNQHAEQIRSMLVLDVQMSQASDPSDREALPSHRQISPPHRPRRIIRPPEGREARRAAYLARKNERSGLAQVSYPENALAKSHSRLGYRQMRGYFNFGY